MDVIDVETANRPCRAGNVLRHDNGYRTGVYQGHLVVAIASRLLFPSRTPHPNRCLLLATKNPYPIFEAVDALARGSVRRAMRHLSAFPGDHASMLITKDGQLTPSGIDSTIDYPIARDLRSKIVHALRANERVSGMTPKEARLLQVLQIVNTCEKLTPIGRIRAIEVLPLEEQCQSIGIPLSSVAIPKVEKKVESDALRFLTNDGATGVACESATFMAIMYSVGAVFLHRLATRKREYSSLTSRTFALEPLLYRGHGPGANLSELASGFQDAAERATEADIRHGLDLYFADSHHEQKYPQLSRAFILEVFRILNSEQMRSIASFISENPYGHRNGWPDLTLVHGSKLRLVEIKVRDRLRFSQIRALPWLMRLFGEVEVMKVARK